MKFEATVNIGMSALEPALKAAKKGAGAVAPSAKEPELGLNSVSPGYPPRRALLVDVFAGAGGLSQGFLDAGFQLAASVESNTYAAATQRHNHGQRDYPPDIIDEPVEHIPVDRLLASCGRFGALRPDVLVGGPPCQGFSRSNMQTRTLDNPLNHLFRYFLNLVSKLDPRAVVLENVADLTRFDGGSIADEIVLALKQMPRKYSVERELLCAADFGVPQTRNRVFFVAFERGLRFDFGMLEKRTPVTLWQAISDLPDLENGNTVDELPYAQPPQNAYQHAMREHAGLKVTNCLVSRNGELVRKRYRHIRQGENWESIPDELMSNYADKSRTHHWIYLRLKQHDPSVTITHFRKSMLIHPLQDRGLSVREAARIQSFRDDFTFCGPLMHQQQQVANAVPPLMAQAVATALRRTLAF